MAGFERGGEGRVGRREGSIGKKKDPKSFLIPYRAFSPPPPTPYIFAPVKQTGLRGATLLCRCQIKKFSRSEMLSL